MDHLLEKYIKVVGASQVERLIELSIPFRGVKWVHVNSTYLGGGVAEILTAMIPLARALGIDAHWKVIKGTPDFFHCTKLFHNNLQGNTIPVPTSLLKVFEDINAQNAEELKADLEDADVVTIHDPQPLPLIEHFPKRKGKWLWRCHIDASRPYRPVWRYLKNFIVKFDASIFSLIDFTQQLPHPMFLMTPSIDPLSEKNIDLIPEEIDTVSRSFGIHPEHPMVLQVSRFDRFKDPLGVIASYQIAKKYKPNLQLVLAGGSATDDPEGELVLQDVKLAAGDDPNIHVLLLPPNAHRTINALQRRADIVLQKSIKEGFGLTVTEALWKGKAVIGGNAGGIRLQVINHHTGFLVNTLEGAAQRIRYLLEDIEKREKMGENGRIFVRDNFLTTRNLIEYMTIVLNLFFQKDDRIEIDTLKTISTK